MQDQASASAEISVPISSMENLHKVYLKTHKVSKIMGLDLQLKSKVINNNGWPLMKNT